MAETSVSVMGLFAAPPAPGMLTYGQPLRPVL